jgi:uncharacterized membrane protein YqgA involved in biofilm formation
MITEALAFGGAAALVVFWFVSLALVVMEIDRRVKPPLMWLVLCSLVIGAWVGIAWCVLYALGARA